MPKYSDFRGAIFDVDDTLLDNFPRDPERRLHSRSRLAAVHAVGQHHGIEVLSRFTAQQNHDAWDNAPVHSVEGAAWAILQAVGLVTGDTVDLRHELVRDITARKYELHDHILRTEGQEVPGASAFVKTLVDNGFEGRLAIASTAPRREIDVFLGIVGLAAHFPDERIVSGSDITHPKPHPEAFDRAYRSLGLSDSERRRVLAFEDHPRGISSAQAAGLYVCAITTAFDRGVLESMANPPDLIADNYAEFSELLGLPAKLEV